MTKMTNQADRYLLAGGPPQLNIKMRKISRLFRQEVILKTDFRVLIFSVFVVFLGAVGLTGCSSQEVYVYEKLPKFS